MTVAAQVEKQVESITDQKRKKRFDIYRENVKKATGGRVLDVDEYVTKSGTVANVISADEISDFSTLDDPEVLKRLAQLRHMSKIKFELILKNAKIKGDLKKAVLSEINKVSNDLPLIEVYATPDHVARRARDILDHGDPVKFFMKCYHKNHRGDDNLGLGCFCSFASGQSLTSDGIQPSVHSENPGMGKTDALKSAFHCLEVKRHLETSVSAMSLYYDSSLEAGDIIFSDDVEWSPMLESTVKRSMSNFQRETVHTTLDAKDRKLVRKAIPPRILWWFSSVEGSSNDQIVDRQFLFDVDNSEGHHKKINDDIIHMRASKLIKFDEDDDVLISREMSRIIKEHGPFKVSIPYAEFIDWKLPRGHRDLKRFLDLIDAFAILRYAQRDPEEYGEATWLTATIQDFWDAKKIFASRQKNIRSHLTDAESRLLMMMVGRSTWTQAELVDKTGFKQGTISKRLMALMDKTNYIKMWFADGEKRYALTDKVDLTIFSNSVVELRKLPTSVTFIETNTGEGYSTLFHTYSTDIPSLFHTYIHTNTVTVEGIYEENDKIYSNSPEIPIDDFFNSTNKCNCVNGINPEKTFTYENKNIGINPENEPTAIDCTRNKCGIR